MFSIQAGCLGLRKVISKLPGLVIVSCIALLSSAGQAQAIGLQGVFSIEGVDGELPAKYANTGHVPEITEAMPETSGFEKTDQNQIWSVSRSDLSLRRALMSWVQKEGWRLQWDAAWDAPILNDTRFEGDFVLAFHNAIATLASSHLFALIDDENHIVRITAVGVE